MKTNRKVKDIVILIIQFIIITLAVIFLPQNLATVAIMGVLIWVFARVILQERKERIFSFAKIREGAKIPTKREEDGCYDLFPCISEDIVIQPFTNVLVPTGIVSTFSSRYRIAFRERGSNTKTNALILAGQIDSGYRNEHFISVYNGNTIPLVISNNVREIQRTKGTKDKITIPSSKALCQFAIEEVPHVYIKEVLYDEVAESKSERGMGKLGSTDKK